MIVAHARKLALAAIALSLTTPATARIVTVNGSGTVANGLVSGGGGASIPVGSALTLTFSFDTDDLELIGSDATSAGYRFTARGLSARIGDYQFVPLSAFGTLSFSRAFGFFGGGASEAVLNQTFAFAGIGDGAPFTFPAGTARTSLAFNSVFRYGFDTPPIDPSALTDPASAARGNFSFAGVPVSGAARASVDGPASGSFITAGVPEPDSWCMMLLGFGGLGYALRRRSTTSTQHRFV